ncbi:AbrB family transcriptional regulator [Coralliovum pocilloporae]|uniref:AbrB family transcriptional regulator n=1 Tax=Coralliovum pocilloporae TaxID=3066369 RepID=UPI0033071BC6
MERARAVGLTLLTGMVGALAAWALAFPAPWLTGPALLVTLAALLGLKTAVPVPLRHICFLIIGLTMGAGVTPEAIETAQRWPGSILLLFAGLILIMAFGTIGLNRLFGYDLRTALLSSTPGHLSFVLSLSTDVKADLTALSIMQSCRVLFLTLVVPFLVVALSGSTLDTGSPAAITMDIWGLLPLTGVALLIGFTFLRLNVPAALLLGGLFVSAIAHATEFSHGAVPDWLAFPAFAVMGTIIGTRFSNVSWPRLRAALAGAGYITLVSMLVSVGVAALLSWFLGMSLPQILVAVAPGGLEAMAAMGVLLGANPAFIAAHHVSRLIFLSFLIPFVLRMTDRHLDQAGS